MKNKINSYQGQKDIKLIVKYKDELLNYLLKELDFSRNKIKSFLTHKQILINNKIVTQYNYPLNKNDQIKINRSLITNNNQKELLNIIYEDKNIIVINKPAGLLSIATDNRDSNEITAYKMLTEYAKQKIFVVHRLDKDTSGILLVAKNQKTKFHLQDNWDRIALKRGYIAIVEGKLKKISGVIKSYLKETKTYLVYSSKKDDGKLAITNYQVLKSNDDYSMVEVFIDTGRKNQIRVHMQDIGHSIIGDKKYGAKTNPIKRIGLHAHILELKYDDKKLVLKATIPKEFNKVVK